MIGLNNTWLNRPASKMSGPVRRYFHLLSLFNRNSSSVNENALFFLENKIYTVGRRLKTASDSFDDANPQDSRIIKDFAAAKTIILELKDTLCDYNFRRCMDLEYVSVTIENFTKYGELCINHAIRYKDREMLIEAKIALEFSVNFAMEYNMPSKIIDNINFLLTTLAAFERVCLITPVKISAIYEFLGKDPEKTRKYFFTSSEIDARLKDNPGIIKDKLLYIKPHINLEYIEKIVMGEDKQALNKLFEMSRELYSPDLAFDAINLTTKLCLNKRFKFKDNKPGNLHISNLDIAIQRFCNAGNDKYAKDLLCKLPGLFSVFGKSSKTLRAAQNAAITLVHYARKEDKGEGSYLVDHSVSLVANQSLEFNDDWYIKKLDINIVGSLLHWNAAIPEVFTGKAEPFNKIYLKKIDDFVSILSNLINVPSYFDYVSNILNELPDRIDSFIFFLEAVSRLYSDVCQSFNEVERKTRVFKSLKIAESFLEKFKDRLHSDPDKPGCKESVVKHLINAHIEAGKFYANILTAKSDLLPVFEKHMGPLSKIFLIPNDLKNIPSEYINKPKVRVLAFVNNRKSAIESVSAITGPEVLKAWEKAIKNRNFDNAKRLFWDASKLLLEFGFNDMPDVDSYFSSFILSVSNLGATAMIEKFDADFAESLFNDIVNFLVKAKMISCKDGFADSFSVLPIEKIIIERDFGHDLSFLPEYCFNLARIYGDLHVLENKSAITEIFSGKWDKAKYFFEIPGWVDNIEEFLTGFSDKRVYLSSCLTESFIRDKCKELGGFLGPEVELLIGLFNKSLANINPAKSCKYLNLTVEQLLQFNQDYIGKRCDKNFVGSIMGALDRFFDINRNLCQFDMALNSLLLSEKLMRHFDEKFIWPDKKPDDIFVSKKNIAFDNMSWVNKIAGADIIAPKHFVFLRQTLYRAFVILREINNSAASKNNNLTDDVHFLYKNYALLLKKTPNLPDLSEYGVFLSRDDWGSYIRRRFVRLRETFPDILKGPIDDK